MCAENILNTHSTSDDLLRYPYSSWLLDSLPLGILFLNTQGEITVANLAAEGILGLTADQMLGVASTDPRWRTVREDGDPLPDADHPAMVALWTGQPVSEVVLGVFNPRVDRHTWIEIKALPVRNEEAETISGVYLVLEDITERKRAAP